MVLVFLSAQLNDLFGSTDEALLEFAEHSENNAIQSRFFEAMGAVRYYRAEIEHIFRKEIHDGFDRFLHPPPRPTTRRSPWKSWR
jgi:activator of 2-hydroxyglutaryl-CoA dehydratase